MTYSEPVRNQKPNRLGTGNRTEPNRFLNYIPRNRTEPNREPEIHQFLETETEPNRTDPTLYIVIYIYVSFMTIFNLTLQRCGLSGCQRENGIEG